MEDYGYGLMRPGPTQASADDRENAAKDKGLRGAVRALTESMSMHPSPLGMAAGAAYQLADKGIEKGIVATIADLVMNSVTRGAPSKINAMGRASKVAPDVWNRIQSAIARGVRSEDAFKQENAAPYINKPQDGITDAWVHLLPQGAAYEPNFVARFEAMKNAPGDRANHSFTIPYREVFTKAALQQLENSPYKGLLDVPVTFKHLGDNRNGEINLTSNKITIDTGDLSGPRSVKSLLAHEGAHWTQAKEGVQSGEGSYGPADALDANHLPLDQRNDMMRKAETFIGTAPMDNFLVSNVLQDKVKLQPGTHMPYPGYQNGRASDEAIMMAQAVAWYKRLLADPTQGVPAEPNQLPHNLYKLYRAAHGEQNAEIARQYQAGETTGYTTPLSKQLFNLDELRSGQYPRRLQELYDLKLKGWDPKADPYTLQQVPALQGVEPERFPQAMRRATED